MIVDTMRRSTRVSGPMWGALLVLVGAVTGCEDGTGPGSRGSVRGNVTVEGVSLAGVTVELTGPENRSVTTDGAGGYEFAAVPTGAYVVSLRNLPDDASFPAISRTAVVAGNQTETVNFTGNFIRTASLGGTVLTGARGLGGVAVQLTGVVSRSVVTDPSGEFRFTGLRSGDYAVEISGFPGSVTFFNTEASVHLATGESHLVTFTGRPQLTASATIRSIARRLPDGATEPADPQDLKGQIEVTITVDRGEDTLESLQLFLGETLVGTQLFTAGGTGGGPSPAAPFDVVFVVGTADFNATTGVVRFTNGPRLLSVRLATSEGGPDAWLSTVPVELRNQNTMIGTVTSERGPGLGDDGNEWVGGDLTATLRAVLYDPATVITAVTVDLRRTGSTQLRVLTVEGNPPFQVKMAGSGVPDGSNVSGYQTPVGETDEFRLLAVRTSTGATLPGFPIVLRPALRIDNVAPTGGSFRLPQQGPTADCCLNNWIGTGFAFSSGLEAAEDEGAGGTAVSIHAGPAGLSDAQIVALPPVSTGAALAPTSQNTTYRAVARFQDVVGNGVLVPLSPSEGNPVSNPRGAVFGVDAEGPQVTFNALSVADRATNPVAGASWLLLPTENLSGLGPLPARTRVLLRAPGVSGGPASCPFPATADCQPARDGLQRDVPAGMEGYLTIESSVLDRAGNRSNAVSRTVLRDLTSPVIHSVQLPPTPTAGAVAPFAAQVSDNIDLKTGTIGLRFEAAGQGTEVLTFARPAVLGEPFTGPFTTVGSMSEAFQIAVAAERAEAGADQDGPTGILLGLAGARVRVRDAAGNTTTATDVLPLPAGSAPQSFSVAQRGDAAGVSGWQVVPQGSQVCRVGTSGSCPPSVPTSVRLTATARGMQAVFQRPFERVHFYVVRDGDLEWIGSATSATVTEGSGPRGRAWTWEFNWTPTTDVSAGPATIRAVGVDAGGNALLTRTVSSLVVVSGS